MPAIVLGQGRVRRALAASAVIATFDRRRCVACDGTRGLCCMQLGPGSRSRERVTVGTFAACCSRWTHSSRRIAARFDPKAQVTQSGAWGQAHISDTLPAGGSGEEPACTPPIYRDAAHGTVEPCSAPCREGVRSKEGLRTRATAGGISGVRSGQDTFPAAARQHRGQMSMVNGGGAAIFWGLQHLDHPRGTRQSRLLALLRGLALACVHPGCLHACPGAVCARVTPQPGLDGRFAPCCMDCRWAACSGELIW